MNSKQIDDLHLASSAGTLSVYEKTTHSPSLFHLQFDFDEHFGTLKQITLSCIAYRNCITLYYIFELVSMVTIFLIYAITQEASAKCSLEFTRRQRSLSR